MTPDMNGPLPDGPLLRLLDASANRAREALRVLEDYARFVLDDGGISSQLKAIRHGLAAATREWTADAILHRDTPGDVGREIKTAAEATRHDLSDVVTAAGKRLGEALRAIEEYLKPVEPVAASQVEALRYHFYEVEHRLAFTLQGAAARDFANVRLYVLITESLCKRPWLQSAEEAILGGADCLQLREKDLESGELLHRARQLVDLCHRHNVLCVVNDRPDVAILSGANGVHLGQGDLPAKEVRKLVGRRMIVGVSTHTLAQAKQARLDGADYVGAGPIFKSPTKPRDFVVGPELARQVARALPDLPAIAIAGIHAGNVDEVLATGVRAVAVASAVLSQDDVRAAAAKLKAKLGGVRNPVAQTFLSVSGGHSCPPETADDADVRTRRRNLPHWTLSGSTYYVTFRLHAETPALNETERRIVLEHLISGDRLYYDLIAGVVMPDHVHALLRPKEGVELSRIQKGIKGVSARMINESRGRRGTLWQDESWDRIVRDQRELDEKLQYMLDNPVRAGLVRDGWDYDAWYVNEQAV